MSQLRKIQRNVEREEEGQVPEDHQRLPVGKILSAPVKGDFLALPLFAWISLRAKTQIPLVMITVLLIRSLEEPMPCGTLLIELPVFEDNRLNIVAALERFGWDGRAWPLDPGWPDGEKVEEENLRALMKQAGLKATLTFPPGEHGVLAQSVTVSRAKGPFLMPPLSPPTKEVDPYKLEKFVELCSNPSRLMLGAN